MWSKVRIVLRGHSGPQRIAWTSCSAWRATRLEKIIGKQMHEAKLEHAATSQAATASAGRWKTA
jgi:hypothetical protein